VQHNCEENGSVDDESACRAAGHAEEDDDEDGDSEDLNEVADRAALSETSYALPVQNDSGGDDDNGEDSDECDDAEQDGSGACAADGDA